MGIRVDAQIPLKQIQGRPNLVTHSIAQAFLLSERDVSRVTKGRNIGLQGEEDGKAAVPSCMRLE